MFFLLLQLKEALSKKATSKSEEDGKKYDAEILKALQALLVPKKHKEVIERVQEYRVLSVNKRTKSPPAVRTIPVMIPKPVEVPKAHSIEVQTEPIPAPAPAPSPAPAPAEPQPPVIVQVHTTESHAGVEKELIDLMNSVVTAQQQTMQGNQALILSLIHERNNRPGTPPVQEIVHYLPAPQEPRALTPEPVAPVPEPPLPPPEPEVVPPLEPEFPAYSTAFGRIVLGGELMVGPYAIAPAIIPADRQPCVIRGLPAPTHLSKRTGTQYRAPIEQDQDQESGSGESEAHAHTQSQSQSQSQLVGNAEGAGSEVPIYPPHQPVMVAEGHTSEGAANGDLADAVSSSSKQKPSFARDNERPAPAAIADTSATASLVVANNENTVAGTNIAAAAAAADILPSNNSAETQEETQVAEKQEATQDIQKVTENEAEKEGEKKAEKEAQREREKEVGKEIEEESAHSRIYYSGSGTSSTAGAGGTLQYSAAGKVQHPNVSQMPPHMRRVASENTLRFLNNTNTVLSHIPMEEAEHCNGSSNLARNTNPSGSAVLPTRTVASDKASTAVTAAPGGVATGTDNGLSQLVHNIHVLATAATASGGANSSTMPASNWLTPELLAEQISAGVKLGIQEALQGQEPLHEAQSHNSTRHSRHINKVRSYNPSGNTYCVGPNPSDLQRLAGSREDIHRDLRLLKRTTNSCTFVSTLAQQQDVKSTVHGRRACGRTPRARKLQSQTLQSMDSFEDMRDSQDAHVDYNVAQKDTHQPKRGDAMALQQQRRERQEMLKEIEFSRRNVASLLERDANSSFDDSISLDEETAAHLRDPLMYNMGRDKDDSGEVSAMSSAEFNVENNPLRMLRRTEFDTRQEELFESAEQPVIRTNLRKPPTIESNNVSSGNSFVHHQHRNTSVALNPGQGQQGVLKPLMSRVLRQSATEEVLNSSARRGRAVYEDNSDSELSVQISVGDNVTGTFTDRENESKMWDVDPSAPLMYLQKEEAPTVRAPAVASMRLLTLNQRVEATVDASFNSSNSDDTVHTQSTEEPASGGSDADQPTTGKIQRSAVSRNNQIRDDVDSSIGSTHSSHSSVSQYSRRKSCLPVSMRRSGGYSAAADHPSDPTSHRAVDLEAARMMLVALDLQRGDNYSTGSRAYLSNPISAAVTGGGGGGGRRSGSRGNRGTTGAVARNRYGFRYANRRETLNSSDDGEDDDSSSNGAGDSGGGGGGGVSETEPESDELNYTGSTDSSVVAMYPWGSKQERGLGAPAGHRATKLLRVGK
jgi:hypothetical protein